MKALYVIRHGQTQWNAEGRMQGRLDSPLTDVGQRQAQTHGTLLKRLGGLDVLYVSPLGRTQETAYILNSHVRAPLHLVAALEERDCGDWSGLQVEEIESSFPAEWRARQADPYGHRPPGGENHEDLMGRVASFLESLYGGEYERVGLVTHGVMSRVIHQYFLGLTPSQAIRMKHPNDTLYQLEFSAAEVQVGYFRNGEGPNDGLYRESVSGTVIRPDGLNN